MAGAASGLFGAADVKLMDARDIFYFCLGAVIGIAAFVTYQSSRAQPAPSSFDECVVVNAQGKIKDLLPFVARLCRKQFPS